MSDWHATKCRRVLAALLRLGWVVKREAGSQKVLARAEWPDTVFAFHDGDEIGPRMLLRVAKVTVLRPEDLARCGGEARRRPGDGRGASRARGSHWQYKHPTKPGLVTVAVTLNDDLAPGTLNSVVKQAGLKSPGQQ